MTSTTDFTSAVLSTTVDTRKIRPEVSFSTSSAVNLSKDDPVPSATVPAPVDACLPEESSTYTPLPTLEILDLTSFWMTTPLAYPALMPTFQNSPAASRI